LAGGRLLLEHKLGNDILTRLASCRSGGHQLTILTDGGGQNLGRLLVALLLEELLLEILLLHLMLLEILDLLLGSFDLLLNLHLLLLVTTGHYWLNVEHGAAGQLVRVDEHHSKMMKK
jgi:hypothetical protein